MSRHDLMVEEFLTRQAAARRIILAIKRARKRETLPSALQVADAPLAISEDHSFYIFRTDTNAVLARGIQGFEAAKSRANELRKSHGLKWDEVKFKAERGNQAGAGATSGGAARSSATPQKKIQFGVSRDGKTFTNAYGERSHIDYSSRFNAIKGRRFRGYTDAQGNYHDID
jgi:hypothetical protein